MRLSKKEIKSALEEGEYPATVLAAEEDVSKEKGRPMLVLVYGVEGPGKRVKVTAYHVVDAENQWCVNMLVDAFGELDGPARQLVGKRCRVAIKLEQYNSRWSPKIASVLPAGAEAQAANEGGDGW